MFAKAGLDVKLKVQANAGDLIAAVLGGSVTISTLTIPGIAVAVQKGAPIAIIAVNSTYSSAAPTSGLIVLADAPYRKASDVNGKTIATRDLSNLTYYGANSWLDRNGGDSTSVRWVELNDSQAVPAMKAGRVDAASVSEPTFGNALRGGEARVFAKCYDGIASHFQVGVSFASRAFAQANPDISVALRGLSWKPVFGTITTTRPVPRSSKSIAARPCCRRHARHLRRPHPAGRCAAGARNACCLRRHRTDARPRFVRTDVAARRLT
jgi:ABC-type nitrate/sulfonate/bicarbonate transport system substrate-binding protein